MLNLGDCDKICGLYARPLNGGRVEIVLRNRDRFGREIVSHHIVPGALERILGLTEVPRQTSEVYETQIPPYTGNWK